MKTEFPGDIKICIWKLVALLLIRILSHNSAKISLLCTNADIKAPKHEMYKYVQERTIFKYNFRGNISK